MFISDKIKIMSPYRAFTSGVFAVVLSGCALVVPPAAPDVYDLSISSSVTQVAGSTGGQILIANPKVLSSLDNDRIVIKPSAAQISFFGDVRWSDRLPRLVQLYFSRAFSKTNGARAVGLPGDGLLVDHQLLFDVSAFQVEVEGNSAVAHVEIAVQILNDKNGKVIATNQFSAKVPTSDDPVNGINGLNKALDAVAADLISWVYKRI
ncbi:MAG: ABC-type transport auxiliary lipoprotein family protein [Hyphomicrobiales bacterium]